MAAGGSPSRLPLARRSGRESLLRNGTILTESHERVVPMVIILNARSCAAVAALHAGRISRNERKLDFLDERAACCSRA